MSIPKSAPAHQGTHRVARSAKSAKAKSPSRKPPAKPDSDIWELKLYVAGQTPKSLAAFDNLKKLCEERLEAKYRIEVVDLLENPKLARDDQIVAIPTLVRKLPPPIRKIIGDLSNTERALVGLQLRSRG